jgi:hypothetical protein
MRRYRPVDLPESANASLSPAPPSLGGALKSTGALALGAFAIGALAIGALAIGRLAIGRAKIRRLDIDELVVRKLRVIEELEIPSSPKPQQRSD